MMCPSALGKAGWFIPRPQLRSDRAGEAGGNGCCRIFQVTVEAHRNVTQQQASLRGHSDPAGLDPDQSVALQGLQALDRVGEIVVEPDVVPALQRRDGHLALAHQLLDQVCAQLVVLAQVHAPEDGKAALVNGNLPAGQVARILAEAVADMADGADAQADQIAVGMGRVAHEIAMQAAPCLCLREVVVGQGEVVHADIFITGIGQLLDGQLQQGELGFGAGQGARLDLAPCLEQVRQVRIAVYGDAVRSRFNHRVQGLGETGRVLFRQAVNQVHVDGTEAVAAAGVDHGQGLFDALDPVHGFLDGGIEILDTQAGPVEADGGQLGDVGRGNEPGIELDGNVAAVAFGEVELATQAINDFAQLRGRQEIGSAAAKMQLDDFTVAVEQGGSQVDLAVQPR